MLAKETQERQEALNSLIHKLSEKLFNDDKEDDVKKALNSLQSIYLNKNGGFSGFRHNYSEFFPLMLDIAKDTTCDLGYLSYNLDKIREYVEQDYINQENQYNRLYQSLRKLCDHLNLEIARLDYYSKNENAILKAEQDVNQLENQTKQALSELRASSRRFKSLQSEMIAVLSVFAAVVMAFFGGINFITSAISNLGAVHIYKSAVIVLIAGIILFNSIFLLMYIVAKIIDRNIDIPCKTEKCTCERKCNSLNRMRKRMPYVYWANILFIVLLMIVCLIWFWVDCRVNLPL